MSKFAVVMVTLLAMFAVELFGDDEEHQLITATQLRRSYDATVSATIDDAQAQLEELDREFVEQIEQMKTAAEAVGNVTAVRECEEAMETDRQMLRAEPERSLWTSSEGFFERLHEGHWIEKVPNGDANIFDESVRTAEYVEISRANAVVRLYDDRCEVRLLPARNYRKFYTGGWQ